MDPERLQRLLLETFALESAEILERVGQSLVALEHAEPEAQAALVNQLFRDLHTLKGSAAAVGFEQVKALSHRLEDMFAELRTSTRALDAATLDRLHAGLKWLERACAGEPIDLDSIVAALDVGDPSEAAHSETAHSEARPAPAASEAPPSPSPSSPTPSAPEPPSTPTADTIRVPTSKLDTLQTMIGELVVVRLQQEALDEHLRELSRDFALFQTSWRALLGELREQRSELQTSRWNRLESRLASHSARTRRLQQRVFQLSSRSSTHVGQLGLLSSALEQRLQDIRMLPIRPYFEAFAVPVRELARSLGKRVRVEFEDRNVEMDRLVLERLRDPLLHLLRNAVAHGIEAPELRRAAGKPELGLLRLDARVEGEHVRIRVSDDGRGLDRAAILASARAQGLVSDAESPSDELIVELLCQPGVSTAAQVDEVSGRGVGLDAVQAALIGLRGTLAIARPEQGTTFVLTVPASLETTQGLIVEAGAYVFGVPVDAIDRVVRIDARDITKLDGVDVLHVDAAPVAWTTLAALLGFPEHSPNIERTRRPTLVLRSGSARLAVTVDDVPGEMPLVVKPLGRQFERVPHFVGAAIQADGSILVVLDARQLTRLATGRPSALPAATTEPEPELRPEPPSDSGRQRTILVVDDSITTRTLERNILEGAGYRVMVAVDGEQAFELLRTEDDIDLVVTDVQMPRMDGFELCRRVRAGRRADLPLIIVTSMGDDREQTLGLEAGADAYIIKGNFAQDHFLRTVERLAGGPFA